MSDLRRRNDGEKSTATQATKETDKSTTTDDPKAKIDKSGLYDLQQVKRLLDDQVMAFMETKGYEEATIASNVKILFGTIAVTAAVYSHFGIGDFQDNKHIVKACVVIYLVCLTVINITSRMTESGALFVGHLNARATQVSKGTRTPKIWVHTSIGYQGSSDFKVEIRKSPRDKEHALTKAFPYEKYFTEEGHFLTKSFTTDLKGLMTQLVDSKKAN